MTEPDRYVRITSKNRANTWINAAHVVAFEEHTDDEEAVVTLHLGPGITATAHGTTGDAVAAALAAATTPVAVNAEADLAVATAELERLRAIIVEVQKLAGKPRWARVMLYGELQPSQPMVHVAAILRALTGKNPE